jgi:hypothetical protein
MNESYSNKYFDLTRNPLETFEEVYVRFRKTIVNNDVLRSLFYYLFG